MERRKCTAYLDTGKRCGKRGWCTRVRILHIEWRWVPLHVLGLAGPLFFHELIDVRVNQDHRVCSTCRERMKLPEDDVDFAPGITNITDAVMEPKAPKAEFTLPGR